MQIYSYPQAVTFLLHLLCYHLVTVISLSFQGSFKNGVVVVQSAPCLGMKTLILQAFPELFKIFPWQTKSILIIIYSFLKMPENAVFWHVLQTSNFKYQRPRFTTLFAKWGKSWQFTALIRSLSVVGQGAQNYSAFYGNGCILPAGGCII